MNMRSKERARVDNYHAHVALPLEAIAAGRVARAGRAPGSWADPDDLQLLTEIALSAAARGYAERVEPIFAALALLRPDNAAAAIGRALSALARRDADTAIEILKRDGVRARVCAAEARALLAIALRMAGRDTEARALCRALADGRDGPARKVALGLLAAELVDA
jgi:thioredoxin-like negative regulator of GroEL